jgi:transposase InsO family protein
MIEDGKLWQISCKASDQVPKTECQPMSSGFQIAFNTHKQNGHFSANLINLKLWDCFFWPGIDTDFRQACIECSHCKNFGPAPMNALFQPIRQVQPFNLVCSDYLSLPASIGNFKTLVVYIDTCSHFIWVSKIKATGSSKTTVNLLQAICLDYTTPGMFMSDGGSHFNNHQVTSFCKENNITQIVTAAYAPWVNSLVENTNNLVVSRLKWLCSPDLDEVPGDVDPKSIPQNWPIHLTEAVCSLNDHIIPTLNATLRKILFGMALQPDTQTNDPTSRPLSNTNDNLDTHFMLTDSFRYATHLCSIKEADHHKNMFDLKA